MSDDEKKEYILETLVKEVEKMKSTVYGNGSPGLCDDIRHIKFLLGMPAKFGGGAILLISAGNLILSIIRLAGG